MYFIKSLDKVGLFWLALLIAAFVYQAQLGWFFESNETTNVYLKIARSCAYCLLLMFTLLWLPVLRNCISWLATFRFSLLLPIKQLKTIHHWLGHVLLFLSLIHGAFYLVYFDSLEGTFSEQFFGTEPDMVRSMKTTMYEFVSEDESIEVMANWIESGKPYEQYLNEIHPILKEDCTKCHNKDSTMTYAIPKLPMSNYDQVSDLTKSGIASRQFRINISGVIMFMLFLVLWISSLTSIRKIYFKLFRQLHRIGYLLPLLILLHIPNIEWLIAPIGLLVLELFLNRSLRFYQHHIGLVNLIHPQFLQLHINLPKHINNQKGYYIQIRSKALNDKDWHDFSLTGINDEQGLAIINMQITGSWTNQLSQFQTIELQIRGPWASPIALSKHKPSWLLIAGGIGITPVLSLLNSCIEGKHKQPKQIKVVWVLKQAQLLIWLKPLLITLFKLCKIRILIYLTSNEQYPGWICDLALEENIELHYGRPNFDDLFSSFQFINKPTLFSCGPEKMMASAKQAGNKHGWKAISEQF